MILQFEKPGAPKMLTSNLVWKKPEDLDILISDPWWKLMRGQESEILIWELCWNRGRRGPEPQIFIWDLSSRGPKTASYLHLGLYLGFEDQPGEPELSLHIQENQAEPELSTLHLYSKETRRDPDHFFRVSLKRSVESLETYLRFMGEVVTSLRLLSQIHIMN